MQLHGKAKEPLLSLSPMPLPPGTNAKVPDGEARGKFALAPGGTLNPAPLRCSPLDHTVATATPGSPRRILMGQSLPRADWLTWSFRYWRAWLMTSANLSPAKMQQLEPYISTRGWVFKFQVMGYFGSGTGPVSR